MSPGTEARFERLAATGTFAGDAHGVWRGSTLAVVGAGTVGGPFAREAVRSGASVHVYDMDEGEETNRGTQQVQVGAPKATTVADDCNAIAPGSAVPRVGDVRAFGATAVSDAALIVDCTDDPALAPPLTQWSNGWGVPLLRIAVDGSGTRELGRALVSHGGGGHACQLCGASRRDMGGAWSRVPCAGDDADRPPTRAGSALAMAIAGLGLLQAQRLVGGNGREAVLDTEVYLDLDTPGILSMRLQRSDRCPSAHVAFDPVPAGVTASAATVGDVLELSREVAGADRVSVAIHGGPLLLGVACSCGRVDVRPGMSWQRPPPCRRCGAPTWRREAPALDHVNEEQARTLSIVDTVLADLGAPADGALLVVRAPARPPVHLLLD